VAALEEAVGDGFVLTPSVDARGIG
jgi:hypothetical protein